MELEGLHPLVPLAGRLALAFVGVPVARALSALALGTAKRDGLENAHERAFAWSLVLPLAAFGALLGFDALDPALVGARIATSPFARIPTAMIFAALTTAPEWRSIRRAVQEPPTDMRSGLHIALATHSVSSSVLAIALFVMRQVSALTSPSLEDATLEDAPLRALLVPTDAMARVALAYRATSTNPNRARRELALARDLGAPRGRALEVEAELLARIGDCHGAEVAFRASLEANVPQDADAITNGRLSLRDFHLPPALVSRCHYGARD